MMVSKYSVMYILITIFFIQKYHTPPPSSNRDNALRSTWREDRRNRSPSPYRRHNRRSRSRSDSRERRSRRWRQSKEQSPSERRSTERDRQRSSDRGRQRHEKSPVNNHTRHPKSKSPLRESEDDNKDQSVQRSDRKEEHTTVSNERRKGSQRGTKDDLYHHSPDEDRKDVRQSYERRSRTKWERHNDDDSSDADGELEEAYQKVEQTLAEQQFGINDLFNE